MAVSNRERVNRAMDLLMQGLGPFVVREMRAKYGDTWWQQYQQATPNVRATHPGELDSQSLLKLMREEWFRVFGNTLGNFEKNLVFELIEARNRWAHQATFNVSDTERVLDSAVRMLQAISANEQADAVDRERQAVRRAQYEEFAAKEQRKATTVAIQSPVTGGGLRSWRDVITPHPDVQGGVFQRAEFAADLAQVHRGEGTDEYADPVEFFRRTYLTEGLRTLIRGGVQRLAGSGGDPVIELQTNFGGGKTHSMLALYHIASNIDLTDIPGLEPIIQDLATHGVRALEIPTPKRAVLVGTALGPNQVRKHEDGTETRTLWGELAWQLGRRKGYALVESSDRAGTNPGADVLASLFDQFSPALILIDEWVAFVRQLYGVDGLAAGSFDANLSFAQSLTEAVRQSDRTLLVASLPASDIEIGGAGGKEALERLRNTFGRMQASWRPATTEEGFEIVRRRLFEPIDAGNYAQRDAVLRAYMDMYRKELGQFPARLNEGDYRKRMEAAYPIHPELFDQLYGAWSTLDKFQRTRGVLRLMASVIHTLWSRNDQSLLIMPANVPMDAGPVVDELTRYLDDPWKPVIEKDVDGEQSLPIQVDAGNPNFGRFSAARRVARTVYLGSAPTFNTANRGIDDRDIKLGVVQPGESVATFGDALRTLSDRATHLYVDKGRYWFSTQPSVTRTAQERAQGYTKDAVYTAIEKRLQPESDRANRGDFSGVHPSPRSTGAVGDEQSVRLVILDPDYAHTRNDDESEALKFAVEMLGKRGESPRLYRNTLVFVGADSVRLKDLEGSVRDWLAWESICNEADQMNLDSFQRTQAENRKAEANNRVVAQLAETYQWVMVPRQDVGVSTIEWDITRIKSGSGSITARVSQLLRNEGALYTTMAGTLLAADLRKWLWRDGNHVSVRQLADYYAQYLYLARLKSPDVLLDAVADGAANMAWASETFALAERYDEATGRYLGLSQAGQRRKPTLDTNWVVVRPDVAQAQIDADRHAEEERRRKEKERDGSGPGPSPIGPDPEPGDGRGKPDPIVVPPPIRKTRRYWANVDVSPLTMSSQASKLSQEIVQHLQSLVGADVSISIEIEAKVPDGIPDDVIRVLRENSSVLKVRYELEEN